MSWPMLSAVTMHGYGFKKHTWLISYWWSTDAGAVSVRQPRTHIVWSTYPGTEIVRVQHDTVGVVPQAHGTVSGARGDQTHGLRYV